MMCILIAFILPETRKPLCKYSAINNSVVSIVVGYVRTSFKINVEESLNDNSPSFNMRKSHFTMM